MDSLKGKGKEKEPTNLNYDASRFTKKLEEKLYNRVWVRNGTVIEKKLDLVSSEDICLGYLQDFTNRGWINLTTFKVQSILIICKEFMENIKYRPVTEKGKERLIN